MEVKLLYKIYALKPKWGKWPVEEVCLSKFTNKLQKFLDLDDNSK
jgi:hypothetical protein